MWLNAEKLSSDVSNKGWIDGAEMYYHGDTAQKFLTLRLQSLYVNHHGVSEDSVSVVHTALFILHFLSRGRIYC